MRGLWDNKNPLLTEKREPLAEGGGVLTDFAGTALDFTLQHGIPYLAKKGVEAGRYYASEALRNKQIQKRAINYGVRKATPVLEKVGSELLDQLSTKVRPNIRYKTDRPDLDGRGIPVPFPFVDFKKLWNVISDPKLFKGPEVSAKEVRAMVAEYKRRYAEYKRQGGTRSYGSWIKWKGYGRGLGSLFDPGLFRRVCWFPKFATDTKFLKAFGKAIPQHHGFTDVLNKTLRSYYGTGVDVHKLIEKLPAPKGVWTLPGHHYTRPYNPLNHQMRRVRSWTYFRNRWLHRHGGHAA